MLKILPGREFREEGRSHTKPVLHNPFVLADGNRLRCGGKNAQAVLNVSDLSSHSKWVSWGGEVNRRSKFWRCSMCLLRRIRRVFMGEEVSHSTETSRKEDADHGAGMGASLRKGETWKRCPGER